MQLYSCHLAKSLHSVSVPLLSLLEDNSAFVIYVDNPVPGRIITRLGHSSLHLQFVERILPESGQSVQVFNPLREISCSFGLVGLSVVFSAAMEF